MNHFTAHKIRSKFLDFFRSKGHAVIASDSVVPKDDPTVLFTTAGMQQFKRQFLGNIDDFTRATTSQKCIRTDDLDEVGQTNFHHTFFEMLGNFSFGDYFKKEAIRWAWEFLTQELSIPEQRLWVSVYDQDQEAFDIWKNEIGLPEHKIFKLGDKSNFWPSNAKLNGPNGPCGPCSEIFFDYQPNDPTVPKDPDDIKGRFAEVWNLVFTQFNRQEGGELEPLPSKNIDTGMGLERLCAVIQGVESNFQTDLFVPIIAAIDKEITANLSTKDKRIIADHIRAATFAINDGIIPSNKERGSVVRKLITRSASYALPYGIHNPCLYKLVPIIAETMKTQYPELIENAEKISGYIKTTEESFIKTLSENIPKLQNFVKDGVVFNPDDFGEQVGEVLFKFHTTNGLPPEVSLIVIKKEVPLTDYEQEKALEVYFIKMTEHREISRKGSKMTGDVFIDMDLDLSAPKTNFLGYQTLHAEAKILRIFKGQESVKQALAGEQVRIVLDQTPFYAESGGQIGDTGEIHSRQGKPAKLTVTDTQKIDDIFLHTCTIDQGQIHLEDGVEALVDETRRLSIMRNHTATHLLQAALRKVLGEHVQQQGSVVDEKRLRFDFTHPKGLTDEERTAVEQHVNGNVQAGLNVKKNEMTIAQARQKGALAFFAEKYGENVRVVHVPGCSTELCGGTHLDNTREIRLFKIISEGAIAQGIRRIEATTASSAEAVIKMKQQQTLDEQEKQKKKQQDKEHLQQTFEALKNQIDSMIADSKPIKDTLIIMHTFEDVDINLLRSLSDITKQKVKSCAVIFASQSPERESLIIALTDDLVNGGLLAHDVIKKIAPLMNGSGAPCLAARQQLPQAGRIVSQCLHLRVVHARCDRAHDLAIEVDAVLVIAALTGLECLELRIRVIRLLSRHAREVAGNTHAVGGMARRAGGQRRGRVAGAIKRLPGLGQRGILGRERLRLLLRIESAERDHVLRRQRGHHTLHDRVSAHAGFEMLQLAGDIVRSLSGQVGIDRHRAIAVGAMAGGANRLCNFLGFGQIRFRGALRDDLRGAQRQSNGRQGDEERLVAIHSR